MIITKLRNNPFFIVLVVLATVSLLGSITLSLLNQQKSIKPQTLPQPTFSSDINLKLNYSYVGQLPELAGLITIYKIPKFTQKIAEQAISQYGTEFGFNNKYQQLKGAQGDGYLFNADDKSLIISTNPNSLEYNNYTDIPIKQIPQDQFIIFAKNFLSGKKIIPKIWSLDNGYVQPVTTDFQGITIPTQNSKEIRYVEVSFNYLLDKKPVIDKLYRDYPVTILLNLDGSVRKATILIPPQEIQSLGSTNTTTPEQALQAINNGQGTFSLLNNPEVAYTEITQGDMTSASFNSVEMVYVYDYDSGSIQPFYRFQGYGYTKNGDKIEVGVIITALPQDLYQK